MRIQLALLMLFGAAACGGAPASIAADDPVLPVASGDGKADSTSSDGYNTKIHLPANYDPNGAPVPLVIMLHGLASNQDAFEEYMQLTPLADKYNFILARPNGRIVGLLGRGWDATDACCGGTSDVDVNFVRSLIDTAKATYNIDPNQVHILGHSNGGYLAHRLACEVSDRIASVLSLSGETWKDESKCTPTNPVSVAEVHSTGDGVRLYNGGSYFNWNDPSAPTTLHNWSQIAHCYLGDPASVTYTYAEEAHVITNGSQSPQAVNAQDETIVQLANFCPQGVDIELWTMTGGSHQPPLTAEGRFDFIQFLLGHPKPGATPIVLQQ